MEDNIGWIGATAVWLFIVSAADIRSRRVPVWLLGTGGIGTAAMLICRFGNSEGNWTELLWGLLPGILLLTVALVTGKVGYGDGIVLLLLGMLLGGGRGMVLLGISLFLISVCSLILLMLRKAGRSSRVPYLPFLTLSWLLMIC